MTAANCSGKRGYDHARAQREARALRRNYSGTTAQPYHCGGCGFWHVGNSLGGRRPANLRRQKLEKIREREAWT